MEYDKIEKRYKTILLIIIAIIYISLFVVVTFKYIDANRYFEIHALDTSINAGNEQDTKIELKVKNKMYYVLGSKDNYFLSYHINNEDGRVLQFDNPRTNIQDIKPGQTEDIVMMIKAPLEKGKYKIVIDIVKEGEYWFEDRGENPCIIQLTVK